MAKVTISQEELTDRYVVNKESCQSIADSLNVSEWWVYDKLGKYKIPRNARGGSFSTIDLSGKRYGHYTAIEKLVCTPKSSKQGARWLCRCDCGAFKEVQSAHLRRGEATSCGKCLNH